MTPEERRAAAEEILARLPMPNTVNYSRDPCDGSSDVDLRHCKHWTGKQAFGQPESRCCNCGRMFLEPEHLMSQSIAATHAMPKVVP